jgi:uncharacterized protein YjbI with pentapeptide repeats
MKNLITFILLFVCINTFGQDGRHYFSPVDSMGPFDSSAYFTEKEFHSTANFKFSVFLSGAYFGAAEFHSTTDFRLVRFHSTTTFLNAEFDSTAVFGSAEFDSTADFYRAKVHSTADFHQAKFNSTADFYQAEFHSTADFSEAKFNSTADFTDAQFRSKADFGRAEFKSGAVFKNTHLPDTLDFSRVKIKDEIDFTYAILDPDKKSKNKEYKCQINLLGSDLSKIKINYELFHLYFPKGTRNEDKISTYEKLRQRFKDLGFLESYKSLDIEYQDYKNRVNGDKKLNWFQKTWWNYGYNKELVIYWALKFLCFFTLINIFLFEFLQSKVYSINFKFYEKEEFNALKEKSKLERQQRKNIFFSGMTFFKMGWNYFLFKIINPLVYTMILFFVLKISIENFKKFSGWVLYIWLIYIAGVFCLAYIFNIIIVK